VVDLDKARERRAGDDNTPPHPSDPDDSRDDNDL
jgi:hypothetical protein